MCATVDLKAQNDFVKKNKNNHKIKLYKLLKVRNFGGVWNTNLWKYEYQSYVGGPYIGGYKFNPGINKSDSKQKLQTKDGIQVDKGIHCFLSKRAAHNYDNDPYLTLVTVYADIDDLICIGHGKQAVFKKVFLSKLSHDRVLNKL